MANFPKRLLLGIACALLVLLVAGGLLYWLQPWRPTWPAVEAHTQEHLRQAGFEDVRITSDDFRWRYNVRATRGAKQFMASVELGLVAAEVGSVRTSTPEGGGRYLVVYVSYGPSSAPFTADRAQVDGKSERVSLDEAQQALYQ